MDDASAHQRVENSGKSGENELINAILTFAQRAEGSGAERKFFQGRLRNVRKFLVCPKDGGFVFAPLDFVSGTSVSALWREYHVALSPTAQAKLSAVVASNLVRDRAHHDDLHEKFLAYCSAHQTQPSASDLSHQYWLIASSQEQTFLQRRGTSYWWVCQGKTFAQERKGQFLWAPKKDSAGRTPFHWQNMTRVRAGDVIFSYVEGEIAAASLALSSAIDGDRPGEGYNWEADWNEDGWRIDSRYVDIEPPVRLTAFLSELYPLMPAQFSPLMKNGKAALGYLFALPNQAGRILLDQYCPQAATLIDEYAISEPAISPRTTETERLQLRSSRVGQGIYRDGLIKLWGGKCSVTGLDHQPLLTASHMKPWRDSNNIERLDPNNGLLLSPALNAVFDKGLVSFAPNGAIMISPLLGHTQCVALGISKDLSVKGLSPEQQFYLEYHRDRLFVAQTEPK